MEDEELISAIRETSRIDDVDRVKDAAPAALSVLGQRIASEETRHLASQLPPTFAEMLATEGGGEQFDIDESYRRVAALEDQGASNHDARPGTHGR
jgi:uncharacterized protein (DUF2267 family)